MTLFTTYSEHILDRPIPAGQLPIYIGLHHYIHTYNGYHPFAEFNFILEGEGVGHINGISHPIAPGTALFIPPNQIHEIQNLSQGTVRKYCCMFDMSAIISTKYDLDWPGWLYKIGNVLPSVIHLNEPAASSMNLVLEQFHQEYVQTDTIGRDNMLQLKLWELLTLFRRSVERHDEIERAAFTQLPSDQSERRASLWPIIHYLHTHYDQELSLDAVADQFHLSVSYLARLFRDYTGKTFLEYLHELRINSAASLLQGDTQLTISEIAYMVGFQSYRTFSRVFREYRGISPSDFRKKTSSTRNES